MIDEAIIRAKISNIIQSEDGEKLYAIYDEGEMPDNHTLWQIAVNYRNQVDALIELLAP